jgi:adenylate cyclase
VWYSDLRNSTALADTMPGEDYLKLLNDYFQCTAAPVIEAGGEVLDFIGDAVLAIFPFEDEEEKNGAICAATCALNKSLKAHAEMDETRKKAGLPLFKYGVGLNVGSLMFGNIGVPQRLSFSVIGPTVNEVARIETMTKITGKRILATKDVAAFEASNWVSLGEHTLNGVSQKVELFTLVEEKDQAAPAPVDTVDHQIPRSKSRVIN